MRYIIQKKIKVFFAYLLYASCRNISTPISSLSFNDTEDNRACSTQVVLMNRPHCAWYVRYADDIILITRGVATGGGYIGIYTPPQISLP